MATNESELTEQLRELAESSEMRFVMDLEFVECLADPRYLQILAIQQHFKNPSFLNYIRYLQYFKEPDYVAYVQKPHALFFLEQLMSQDFRSRLTDGGFIQYLCSQQAHHWKHFRANRYREAEADRARMIYQRTLEGLEATLHTEGAEGVEKLVAEAIKEQGDKVGEDVPKEGERGFTGVSADSLQQPPESTSLLPSSAVSAAPTDISSAVAEEPIEQRTKRQRTS